MVASAEAKSPAKQKKESKALSLACHKKPVSCGNFRFSAREGPRRFPKGDRKALWSPAAEAKPSAKQKKESKTLSLACHKKPVSCGNFRSSARDGPRRFPKGERKALWSPPQRRNPLRNRKKKVKLFPLPVTRNLFLVGGFVRLRADEVLSQHGKVPKGCRGRPKGACLMAAPGPPVAKQQCTASLAGARPAGFTSVPGRATVAFKVGFHFVKAKSLRDPRIRLWRKRGLAQLIPPPAPRRRSILGVMARCRHGRATLPQYVPQHRGHVKCVSAPAPDWLLAPGQTKWRARYGPCRSRDKGKYPFRYRGGPGVSLGRLKGV